MGQLMALFSKRLESGHVVADHLMNWPGNPEIFADNAPLRLAGALHAIVLNGGELARSYPPHKVDDDALWANVNTAIHDHTDHIMRWLRFAPQTNEVRRSAAILAAMSFLQERSDTAFELFELGCSGGLNLRAEQFALTTPVGTIGRHNSLVELKPDWSGEAPANCEPVVIGRNGVDLNPLDPANADDALRLLAYLWPDQPDRLSRTRSSIEIASNNPASLAKADAASWLERALEVEPRSQRLVFHTVAYQYFPETTKRRVEAALEKAGSKATHDLPLSRLSMEADGGIGAALTLTRWPDGQTISLGRADFHGRWINWKPESL